MRTAAAACGVARASTRSGRPAVPRASSSPPGVPRRLFVERELEPAHADARVGGTPCASERRAARRRAPGPTSPTTAPAAGPSGEARACFHGAACPPAGGLSASTRAVAREQRGAPRQVRLASEPLAGEQARELKRPRPRHPRAPSPPSAIFSGSRAQRAEQARVDAHGHRHEAAGLFARLPAHRQRGWRSPCAAPACRRRSNSSGEISRWAAGVDVGVHRRRSRPAARRRRSRAASAPADERPWRAPTIAPIANATPASARPRPLAAAAAARRARRAGATGGPVERGRRAHRRPPLAALTSGNGRTCESVTELDWIIVAFAALLAAVRLPAGLHRGRAVVRRLRGRRIPRNAPRVRCCCRRGPPRRTRPRSGWSGRCSPGAILATGAGGSRLQAAPHRWSSPGLGLLDGLLGAVLAPRSRWASFGSPRPCPRRRPATNSCAPTSSARQSCARSTGACRRRARSSTRSSRLDPLPSITGPSPDVAPPQPAVARQPGVSAASRSVVRVLGTACGLAIEGSGWVAAPEQVVHQRARRRRRAGHDGRGRRQPARAVRARDRVRPDRRRGGAARPRPAGAPR